MIGIAPRTLSANFRSLFRAHAAIFEEVSEGRQFDALYFSMLVFGCLIALLGLLLNSPAVIIGAMLISPLMGPILSCGLALALADGELARKAGRNLGLSILETIFIAAVAAWLSPLKDVTPEILARTNPNLMDLLVAFFSGVAGTLALCSRKPGFTIVPGVAIATAVMPPLATVGYGISTRQWPVAFGSFTLFFTNLASIIVSADLVFLLVGVRQGYAPQQEQRWWVRHRMAISWAVLLVLSIPLVKTLVRAADQRRARNEIRSTLAQKFNHPGTSRLDEVTVELGRDLVSAEATVQTAKLILPNEEQGIEQELSQQLGRKVTLRLDQIQLAQLAKPIAVTVVGHDYVAGGKIQPPVEKAKLSVDEMLQRVRESAHDALVPMLNAAGVEDFAISSVGEEKDGSLAIELTGTYHGAVTEPATWKVISAAAAQKFDTPVHLTATMYLPKSQISWIRYRRREVRPSTSELRKAQRLLADWNKRGLEHGFIAGADTDAKLFEQRLEYLQSRSGQGVKLPADLTSAGNVVTNAVGLAAVQLIDVSMTPTTSATPALTPAAK